MEYLHLFDTESEFNEVYNGSGYTDPWVSYTKETSGVTYNKAAQPPHDYSQDYLTFNIISGGSINWKTTNTAYTLTISYSKDNGTTWTDITSTTGGTKIYTSAGDKVMFKGDNVKYASSTSSYHTFSGSTANFEAEGNIMSLINSNGFTTATALENRFVFYCLFSACGTPTSTRGSIISAKNLVLPATTLSDYCYKSMFSGCTYLTTAPALPATNLSDGDYCYESMFLGCTSLTTAPELPATTLSSGCYKNMFSGCRSLVTAPELPVTTLASGCYSGMFQRCTSLTTAPELPATTLAINCYYGMFQYCSSLNYIKCLATNISADFCTFEWVYNVAASGTFVKNPNMSSWTTGNNGIPTNWTVQDAS